MNIVSKKIIMLLVMVGIFLLPIQPSFEINKDGKLALGVKTNTAEATLCDYNYPEKCIQINNGTILDTTADFTAMVFEDTSDILPFIKPTLNNTDHSLSMIINFYQGKIDDPNKTPGNPARLVIPLAPNVGDKAQTVKIPTFTGLTADTDYSFSSIIYRKALIDGGKGNVIVKTDFHTAIDPTHRGNSTTTGLAAKGELDLKCGVGGWLGSGSLYGCVAALFWLVFQVASLFAHIAGLFLDFFIYYSTNSTSYNSEFINKGWAALRDVVNIFFIIALLYIAIKTILSLNVTDNKKMIGTIIIVALLINFSLFFTRVIVDSSNILAKIFYNNIDSKYDNGNTATGPAEQKSISVGLVDKFNPELLITQKQYDDDGGTTTYIFLTTILILLISYTAYMFFTVCLLFVGRVASLWISMIFAPVAFVSYILPFDIPKMGHKDWWTDLFKNAFLAPIFIFMLYIVVMFTQFLSKIINYPTSSDFFQKIMAVVIPFLILFVLLMKAKDLAVEYSGEMGKAMQKFGSTVGGFAVGAATGGLAMAGRGTLGAIGSKIANSSALAKLEAGGGGMGKFGKMLGTGTRNIGKTAAKGSFDIRGVKVGGKSLADTGLKVGKAKEGGYEKDKADKSEKRQKRADELKTTIEKGKKGKAVKKTEEDLQTLLNANQKELAQFDKEITEQEKVLTEANQTYGGGSKESKIAGAKLSNIRAQKKALREGTEYAGDREVVTKQDKDGNDVHEVIETTKGSHDKFVGKHLGEMKNEDGSTRMDPKTGKVMMRSIANLEKTELVENKHRVEEEQRKVANDYAKKITSKKVSNLFGLLNAAEKDASHKIIMGVKLDSDGKKAH